MAWDGVPDEPGLLCSRRVSGLTIFGIRFKDEHGRDVKRKIGPSKDAARQELQAAKKEVERRRMQVLRGLEEPGDGLTLGDLWRRYEPELKRKLSYLSQHIPPRGCRTLSRHGWFACALGQFEERGRPMGERPATPSPARPRRTPWALLIQWVWKVEPERCPCGAMMRRSRAILERHELVRLLTALHLAGYPRRPPAAPIPEGPPVTYGAVGARRSTPPPRPGLQVPSPPLEPPQNEHNQVPPGWEDWLD